MKTSEDLKQILERIDHRGYPAYKDTRGAYQFGTYILGIDHVQGDPFAAPSRLHIQVAGRAARIPGNLYDSKCKKMAVADYLLRNFAKQLERYSFQAHGSGKSGIIQVTRCGQEVLERTACEIEEKTGNIIVRFEVGFPARGRTIQADEWLMTVKDGIVTACSRTGGTGGWQLYSISRWSVEDGRKLRQHLEIEFEQNKNRQIYWDDIAMFCYPEEYRLGIYPMKKDDIIEIDNLSELAALDASYQQYMEAQ